MIKLDIEVGDIILTGKFKNKKVTVKEIGVDEHGLPTINGKSILKIRVPKLKQTVSESLLSPLLMEYGNADIFNDYLKGKLNINGLLKVVGGDTTKIAKRSQLEKFLNNSFMIDVMADEHNIDKAKLISKVKELLKVVKESNSIKLSDLMK